MPSAIGALRQLATLYGVRTSYFDIGGRKRRAEPEGLLAVLRALGAPIARIPEAPEALRERVAAQWRRGAEPVVVAWGGRVPVIDLHAAAADLAGPIECTLQQEDGEVRRWRVDPSILPVRSSAEIEGQRHVAVRLRGPAGLPQGYHRLLLERGGEVQETLIISAPRRAYRPPMEEAPRSWGLFLPLYALHSRRSWASGDLTDLEQFMSWVGGLGGRVVGTLPLLATFLDELFEASPYVPASRLFWNEFFLDPARSPDLPRSAEARALLEAPQLQADLEEVRGDDLVDYRRIARIKRPILEALARDFFAEPGERGKAFDHFRQTRPALEDYARFRAVSERLRLPWQSWPAPLRDGEIAEGDFDEEARRYHLYVQFLLHEQLSTLSREKGRRSAGLYLDLPLGVHNAGYDTWKERDAFAFEIHTGAPPDPLFAGGQNWGFPPLHPQRIREQGYRYVIEVLRHHLRHAAVLRVDHVMGLHRLFWIPKGFPATAGVYVRYVPEELYAILSLESHRYRTQVVGEDLGTVPPSVRRSLGRHNISGMYVVQYEATSELGEELRPITRDYLGSLNTHDMPPFAAMWYGLDLPSPQGLAPADAAAVRALHRHRAGLKAMMVALLRAGGWLTVGSSRAEVILRGLLAHLAASPAGLIMINLEDLWLERRSQNIPGTGVERPNWRRRTRYAFEEFSENKAVVATLRLVNRLRGEPRGHEAALAGGLRRKRRHDW